MDKWSLRKLALDSDDWFDARSENTTSKRNSTEDLTSRHSLPGLITEVSGPPSNDTASGLDAFLKETPTKSQPESKPESCQNSYDKFIDQLEEQCEPEELPLLQCVVNLGAFLNKTT